MNSGDSKLKYKVLLGILLIGLVVSLGAAGYFYALMNDRQAQINNLLSRTILTYAREISFAGYLLRNATTNIAVADASSLLMTSRQTADTAWLYNSQTAYLYMAEAAGLVEENLAPYCEGAPTSLNFVNQTAVEMFAVLYTKIQNLTRPILDIWELEHPKGRDPIDLFNERGLTQGIVDNCSDVMDYSFEIDSLSPKFE